MMRGAAVGRPLTTPNRKDRDVHLPDRRHHPRPARGPRAHPARARRAHRRDRQGRLQMGERPRPARHLAHRGPRPRPGRVGRRAAHRRRAHERQPRRQHAALEALRLPDMRQRRARPGRGLVLLLRRAAAPARGRGGLRGRGARVSRRSRRERLARDARPSHDQGALRELHGLRHLGHGDRHEALPRAGRPGALPHARQRHDPRPLQPPRAVPRPGPRASAARPPAPCRGDSRTAPAAGRGPLPAGGARPGAHRPAAGAPSPEPPGPSGHPGRFGTRTIPGARRGDILAPCASAHGHLRQMEPP